MKKEKERSLSTQAYHTLKEAIVTCQLEPGQLIVQADLAAVYDVGVTPIREGLRRLALEGYVVALPRLGYQVSPITLQDVQEIFEMRLILECAAARLAAERATPEQLQSIAASANFSYTYKKRDSYIRFLRHNADFHLAIASASGNQRLVAQIHKTLEELNRVFHLGLDVRDSAEVMRSDHVRLSDALCKRYPDQAETIVRDEILISRDRVMEAIYTFQQKQKIPLGPNVQIR